MNILEKLMQPGDLLTYSPSGAFGFLISVKTWHKVSHVEIYTSNGQSMASRDGQGIGLYPLRTKGLLSILRPRTPFDFRAMMAYFYKVNGSGYNWQGILGFSSFVNGKTKNEQFCSEFVTNDYRAGGVEPFTPGEPAYKVAPFQLEISSAFNHVWKKGKGIIAP